MFKIGDFSRLTRVSVKTLHYYDEIGLFKPLVVDRFTGYRYYSFEQLPRLNRILALKDIGFSLEQIGRILDADLSADQLQAMLELRQAELAQQVADAGEKLSRVKVQLQQIEQEGKMAEIQVIIKPVGAVTVAGAREVVSQPAMMRERCGALHDEVVAYMKRHNLKCISPNLALYYDSGDNGIDVEMAYTVETPQTMPPAEGSASVHIMPAVQAMASAVYHGSYDAFEAVSQVYAAVGKWIETNGYRINGASREIYVQTPDWSTQDRIGVMEIQFPVEKA